MAQMNHLPSQQTRWIAASSVVRCARAQPASADRPSLSAISAYTVRLGLTVYAEIADKLGRSAEAGWARAQRTTLDAAIQRVCWDGKWFIWAIGQDGAIYGTKHFAEGQVY